MKSVFEEYGDVILQVLGGLAILAVIIDMIRGDGILHELISSLADGAC